MVTGPPAPDDRQAGNRRQAPADAVSFPGGDPLEARRARLAVLWALVLRRFRDYAHRNGGLAAGRAWHGEEDR